MWLIIGIEHAITSDGFFELEQQPKNVVVVGAGYIAVELSGIFNALGTKVNLLIRGQTVRQSKGGVFNACISVLIGVAKV